MISATVIQAPSFSNPTGRLVVLLTEEEANEMSAINRKHLKTNEDIKRFDRLTDIGDRRQAMTQNIRLFN